MLEALIFDVDGTLADTERDGHRPAYNAAFADAGLTWHWDVALYSELLAVTGGKERMRFYAERYAPDFLRRADCDERIKAMYAAKTKHYLARLDAGEIPLKPGVERVIREARDNGLRLAVATTTAPENVTALLRASLAPEAPSWFEVIGAGDMVPNKKPAPDIYLWVLHKLGLPASACLAFEDSANGFDASRAAGLPTLVCESEYVHDRDFPGAIAVISDLGEANRPTAARSGDLHGKSMVDLELLRLWHKEAAG